MGVDQVGTAAMSWGEALRLSRVLAQDPSSRVAAAVAGWDRPASFGDLILMDLFDQAAILAWSQAGGKGKRPKPYPRPWPTTDRSTRRTKPTVSQDVVIAALRSAGHTRPIPTT